MGQPCRGGDVTLYRRPIESGVRRLRVTDPGLLRLRNAVKAVAAVGVTLAVFRFLEPAQTLFAAISSAFLVQCYSGESPRKQQMMTMAISAAAMTLLTGLGAALRSHSLFQEMLVVAVAFGAHWVRNFIPGRPLFPVFGFVLVLLSTALPGSWQGVMAGVGGGFPAAFVLRFFLWRRLKPQAFEGAVVLFTGETCRAVHLLVSALETGRTEYFDRKLTQLSDDLHDALQLSEAIARTMPGYADFAAAVADEYRLLHGLAMLRRAVLPLAGNARFRTSRESERLKERLESLEGSGPFFAAADLEGPSDCGGIYLSAAALWIRRVAEMRNRLMKYEETSR
jgi:hypothetical protein